MAEGSDLLRPIILMVTIVSSAAIMIGMMDPTLEQAKYSEGDIREMIGMQTYDDTYYTWYEPEPATITNANVTDNYRTFSGYRTPAVNFTATPSHMHDIDFYVIRNASYGALQDPLTAATLPDDGLIFHMNWGVFNTEGRLVGVSYELIENNFNDAYNYSRFYITLNTVYAVFIQNGPGNFHNNLWANEFNVSIGYSLNQSIEDISPWSLIGQILTFSLPDTDPTIRILIAIPFYITIAFCLLMIISKFIPLTG